jgi:two-component system nitrogen regulation response regulator GlnG
VRYSAAVSGPPKAPPRGASGVLGAAPLLYLTHPETGLLLRRRWQLVVTEGPDAGRIAELTSWTVLVGAAPAAALVLTDDAVSRYHAELDLFAEGLRIRDLDSTNGTFLMGEDPIQQGFLRDGEQFRVGETGIRVVAKDEVVPEPALEPGVVDALGTLVAAAPVTRRLFARLQRVAGVRSTVLLVGPPGTGKGALARGLHQESRRKNGPFIVTDLRSPEPLAGSMEAARGGTWFLDRVESLPRARQGELLALLERLPVGGRDVRVVAASTRPLRAPLPIDARLAAHLAVVVLEVPALAHRPEDIGPLAERYAAGLSPPLPLGPRTRALLTRHDWPGHLAGLERSLQRLQNPAPQDDGPFMHDLRTAFLEDLMQAHRGHVTEAGATLGLTTRALFEALDAHRVELDDLEPVTAR